MQQPDTQGLGGSDKYLSLIQRHRKERKCLEMVLNIPLKPAHLWGAHHILIPAVLHYNWNSELAGFVAVKKD